MSILIIAVPPRTFVNATRKSVIFKSEGARLTDAQVQVLEGQAQMLRQSGFKVDTKDAPQINIRNNSIFGN